MNLQKKYFLTFFSLFVILSLAMSIATYFQFNRIILRKYEKMSADSLSYLLEITDRELNQLTSTLTFIANNKTVSERITTDYGEGESYRKLTDDRAVTDIFHAMSTFEIIDSISTMYIRGINDEEYWPTSGSDFMQRDQILLGIDMNALTKTHLEYHGIIDNRNPYTNFNQVLRFTKTLLGDYARKVGVVYFELGVEYFRDLYENQNLGIDTRLYLVDGNNKIIYNEEPYMVGRSLDSVDIHGVVVEKTLDNYGWRMISESPESQIYAESSMLINISIIMALVSILASMLLISLVTGRIVQPIKRLTAAMTEVSHGNMDARVYHISNDEIGEMTDNFNLMARQLTDNINREREYTKALRDAEYQALQSQINPHFMYNSLNALKWLAGIQGADNITEMVDSLWTLLRKASSRKGEDVTLRHEIEIIQAYCAIQQVRYKGKFEVIYNLEEAHKDLFIPKYILQPFVENAIFHGIEPKKGPGQIVIQSDTDGKDLVLSVSDNGVGIPDEKKGTILTEARGVHSKGGLNNIGVRNINKRLILLFGEEYGILMQSEAGKGTVMTIRIPLQYSPLGDKNV
ncbi:MAG: histidine kinase [Spirochaetales bacterium]|nr:histidine kinase [Spirochaetales bacterium]